MMNCTVSIDWRSLAVLGLTAVGIYLVYKDPTAGKDALVHVSDAVKACAEASKASC